MEINDGKILYNSEANNLISESIIKMIRDALKPLEISSNTNLVMSKTLGAMIEPLTQLINRSLPNQHFDIALSKALSESISQLIKKFQLPKSEIDLNNTQAFKSEPVSEEVAEKAVELIENTANLLEKSGVNNSQIQELKAVKNKKSFTINEVASFFTIIVSIITIYQVFFKKDTTVNNYNQDVTINYNINITEKESIPPSPDEEDINQICDYLSRALESLLTPQEVSGKSEESSESADSPLPEPKVETDTQESTEISTQDNH